MFSLPERLKADNTIRENQVDLVNQRKKHFAEERAKVKRNKPMTQSQLRTYMSILSENQGNMEAFSAEEVAPTKAQLKRYREELQTEISKKQRIVDKDVSVTEEEVAKVKEEEPAKRIGTKEQKGLHLTRDDLKELYRLMMLKYGDNSCNVYCLTMEAAHIYMLTEVKYPLPPRVCKAMLEKKLLGDRKDESTMSNRHKDWLVQEQTALGKDFSNPFMADNLPKIVWYSTHHICVCEELASPQDYGLW
ncbi:hypothetical protein Tco_0795186 [Tanacetum coccineum]